MRQRDRRTPSLPRQRQLWPAPHTAASEGSHTGPRWLPATPPTPCPHEGPLAGDTEHSWDVITTSTVSVPTGELSALKE